MSDNKEYAIIVAGGKSLRLPGSRPKQFLELDGTPVLMHTVKVFYAYSPQIQITVVLPESEILFWQELCAQHDFHIPHQTVIGGASRFQSVKKGLDQISGDGFVAIHDGVRPLVRTITIADSFRIAQENGAAVAVMPCKDSLRLLHDDHSEAMDRSRVRMVQTPQTFQTSLIKKAYEQEEKATFTDDAAVVDQLGQKVELFEGSYDNLKITTQEDLTIAVALMRLRQLPH